MFVYARHQSSINAQQCDDLLTEHRRVTCCAYIGTTMKSESRAKITVNAQQRGATSLLNKIEKFSRSHGIPVRNVVVES